MQRTQRITLTEPVMFPAQVFFNSIPDDKFTYVMLDLKNRIGYGYNGIDCSFPSESDPDFCFEGVRFSTHDEEVIVTEAFMWELALAATKSYLDAHPEHSEMADLIFST